MDRSESVVLPLDLELITSATVALNLKEWHGEGVRIMESGLERLQFAKVSRMYNASSYTGCFFILFTL